MKAYFLKRYIILAFFLLLVSGETKAQVLFGNTPDGTSGDPIITSTLLYNSGPAVEFTPTQNITISSVSLWLSGYTQPDVGLALYEPEGANFLNNVGGGFTAVSSPNDGSLGEFTFDSLGTYNVQTLSWVPGPVTLYANQQYWLASEGSVFASSDQVVGWVGGTTPTGDAVYDTTEEFSDQAEGIVQPIYPYTTPAFTLNAVPEPSSMSFAIIMAASIFICRSKWRTSRAVCFAAPAGEN